MQKNTKKYFRQNNLRTRARVKVVETGVRNRYGQPDLYFAMSANQLFAYPEFKPLATVKDASALLSPAGVSRFSKSTIPFHF